MRKKKQQPVQEVMPTVTVPATPLQEWVINCHTCGAALNVKGDNNAYICPVCNTLFRIQTGTRIVKEITPKEKQVMITLTEKAVNLIVEKDAIKQRKAAKKKRKPSARKQRRMKKKIQRALETVLAANVRLSSYEESENMVVDLDENGFLVKKS